MVIYILFKAKIFTAAASYNNHTSHCGFLLKNGAKTLFQNTLFKAKVHSFVPYKYKKLRFVNEATIGFQYSV